MPRLTDTHRVLLSAAAQRDDGALLPLPKRVKLEPRALTRAFKALLKKELVTEQSAPPDAPAWRETDDGQRFMLVVAPAGLEAIGVEAHDENEGNRPKPSKRSKSKRKTSKKADQPEVRPGTKIALMIEMLSRNGGATITEIVNATGWQQHSVRGAISGTLKKKLGLTVTSETDENRRRVYRIAQAG